MTTFPSRLSWAGPIPGPPSQRPVLPRARASLYGGRVVEITVSPARKSKDYTPPTTPAPTPRAAQKRRERARAHGLEPSTPSPESAPDTIDSGEVALSDDLAAVVVKKTLRRMASGELQPSLRDGLIAQQLIDRREEKAADRQFMLSLARALAGGGYEAPSRLLPANAEPPDDAIEGYFEEIPLAPEHLRAE